MKSTARMLFLCLVLILPMSLGCSKYAVMKRQETQRRKEMVKEKERRELESQAAYEQAIERQYAMQTKETRKSMRQNMKNRISSSVGLHPNKSAPRHVALRNVLWWAPANF
jgi:uncharacterized protein HemX